MKYINDNVFGSVFSQSHDNKSVRARNILNHLNRIHVEIYRQCDIVLRCGLN